MPEKAGLPIVAMTANAFDEDRQNAEKAGMNGHLSKPFDMQQLLTMLREKLSPVTLSFSSRYSIMKPPDQTE